ncbi:NUDIX hydrolase [Bifidobacterium myosotis]|nr:NUDIX hydrolase [Bifidobacterium myosotis]
MRHVIEAAGGLLYRWKADDDRNARWNGRSDTQYPSNTPNTLPSASATHTNPTAPNVFAPHDVTPPSPSGTASPSYGCAEAADNVLNHIELCIVHRPKYDDWSWPKGKLDPNESARHAAVREIGEETGLPVALGPYLGDVEYPQAEEGSKQRHTKDLSSDTKRVQFWMATAISPIDNLKRTQAFGPVHRADVGEIDELVWLTPAEARRKLTHSTDRDILALFVDRVEEGALDALPFLLVRHGKAEARKLWKGTDANRPITPRGAAAAFALNYELACFNPVRLTTSPWIRCMETLQTFSWQTGRPMITLDQLTEDSFAQNPDAAWDCLFGEITYMLERREPTAICMHRPVIGGMFEHLRSLCASPALGKRLIAKTPYMPTGTALALFVIPTPDGPKIIDIQKVHPLVY